MFELLIYWNHDSLLYSNILIWIDSTTTTIIKTLISKTSVVEFTIYLTWLAQQQELDPIRIFRASASAVLLDDWADSP